MNGKRSLQRRFAEPLLLAVLTVAGLIAALIGAGPWKVLGDLAVAAPLLAMLRHGIRSRRLRRHLQGVRRHDQSA